MSEDAAERRKRIKALKEKAAAKKSIKFRNYRPQDAEIREQALDSKAKAGRGRANDGAATLNRGGKVVRARVSLRFGVIWSRFNAIGYGVS